MGNFSSTIQLTDLVTVDSWSWSLSKLARSLASRKDVNSNVQGLTLPQLEVQWHFTDFRMPVMAWVRTNSVLTLFAKPQPLGVPSSEASMLTDDGRTAEECDEPFLIPNLREAI